jgi:hypothetical protein
MKKTDLENMSLDELSDLNAGLMRQKEAVRAEQLRVNEVITKKTQAERLARELARVSKTLGVPVQEILASGIASEEKVGD